MRPLSISGPTLTSAEVICCLEWTLLIYLHMKEPTYEQMMKYILLLKSMEAAGMELNEQQKNILRMCKEKGVLNNNPEKALEGKD